MFKNKLRFYNSFKGKRLFFTQRVFDYYFSKEPGTLHLNHWFQGMLTQIRPDSSRRNCPQCNYFYSIAKTVDGREIYECENKHSWEKNPQIIITTPQIISRPSNQTLNTFQEVYKPLHDTQEPVKHLFKNY